MARCRSCGTSIEGGFIRCAACRDLANALPPVARAPRHEWLVEVLAWHLVGFGVLVAFLLIQAAAG